MTLTLGVSKPGGTMVSEDYRNETEQRLQRLLDQAEAFGQAGDYTDALAAYRDALTLAPDSADARYGVALALWCLDEHQAAVATYEELIAADPTLEQAYTQLAVLLLEIERPAEAIAAYRCGLAALPDNVTLLNDLGTTLADEGELTEAVELLERALILAPDDAMLLFNLGNFHDLTGRQETAIDYYRRALRLEPHDLETTYNLALCLQDQEQYADALDQFARVIEYGGERPEAAHLNAGLCFSNLGQLPMAEASYRRSVEIEPDYHLGWYNLGYLYERLRRPEEALAAFQEAARCDPDDEESRERIAELLEEQG
jgi:tetratricopeptide (TPR) repeat protein